MLGFNDMSILVGHFVSSSREREKRDRGNSRRNEREGQGKRRKLNESEETEDKNNRQLLQTEKNFFLSFLKRGLSLS